jgi:hypothetical protein
MRFFLISIFFFVALLQGNATSQVGGKTDKDQVWSKPQLVKVKHISPPSAVCFRAKKHVRKTRGIKEFSLEITASDYTFISFNTLEPYFDYSSPSQKTFCQHPSGRAPPTML